MNAAVIWFIVGLVLFLLEFAVPGLILFFFAVGAWVVAFLTLFLNWSLDAQLFMFLGCSILSVLLFRKWLKNLMYARKQPSEVIEDEFVGRTALAETLIAPGKNGRVEFNGVSWDASSTDTIDKGDQVVITGNDSILLFVKSIKSS